MNFEIIATEITKSKSDESTYQCIKLQNGLKAFLVSDPKADTSAASLTVGIGYLEDPQTIPGLAHFIEHMLSMGSTKYPDEAEFNKFLNENGGKSNASTGTTETTYYFEISNNSFEHALDMFAHFFIDPLFKEDTVQREMLAVDQEFKKNLLQDIWRLFQLKSSQAKEGSEINRFSTGNLDTLNIPNIRDEMIKMYKKHYSSDIMTLSVLSNRTIDQLRKLVSDLFSEVHKIDGYIRPVHDKVPYEESNCSLLYKIVPIQDKDELEFIWMLENSFPYYKEIPISYISCLLGHEGPNTLSSSLIRDNLITAIITSIREISLHMPWFLSLRLVLTQKGLKEYNTVIQRVFKYIKVIQTKGVNERFYDENISLEQIKFDYQYKRNPFQYTVIISKKMQYYDMKDVLSARRIYIKKDVKLVEKYLNSLTMKNVNIFFSSKTFEKECTLKEKWYGTLYSKGPLSEIIPYESIIDEHKCEYILDYPPENTFIPKSFDIIKFDECKDKKYPYIIFKDEKCTIWYKKDNLFKLPRTLCKGIIRVNRDICNFSIIKKEMICLILKHIFKNELNEILYLSSKAETKFKILFHKDHTYIKLKGFGSSLLNAIKELTNRINQIIFNDKKEKVELYIAHCIQKLKSFFTKKGYLVAIYYIERLLLSQISTYDEILTQFITNPPTVDDIVSFISNYFNTIHIEWIIVGNVNENEAIEIGTYFHSNMKFKNQPIKTSDIISLRPININKCYNYIFTYKNPINEDPSSTIFSFFQCGRLNVKERCILLILESLMKEEYYDDMRTKKGLGYVVWLYIKSYKGNYGLATVVQSGNETPELIWRKTKEFLIKQKENVIDVLDDELFNKHVQSVYIVQKAKFVKLGDEVKKYYNEIVDKSYQFDIKEKICAILENKEINIKDVKEFFYEHFVNNIQQFDFEYVSKKHLDRNEEIMKENMQMVREGKKYIRERVYSTSEFKAKNGVFSDFGISNEIL